MKFDRFAIFLLLVSTTVARAQFATGPQGAAPPSDAVPNILKNIGIDQNLGASLPLDAQFTDETGTVVRLGDYFNRGRPVILTLVYYNCPALCTTVLNDLTRAMNVLRLDAGKDFDIVTVSFDPRERSELAAAKKRQYLKSYHRSTAEQGWHFLTGDEVAIKQLTSTVGFRYDYDKKLDQYYHAGGIMVITPDGHIARYFYGIAYAPKDLRLALIESSQGSISSPVDRVLTYCFRYDPHTGRYSFAIMSAVRLGGILTVLALGTYMFVNFRRDRKLSQTQPSTS